MHTCAHDGGLKLFTWELRKKAQGRRWFYTRLDRILARLPSKSWCKIGGSVYLVATEHSGDFRKLLRQFESRGLIWHEFTIEV